MKRRRIERPPSRWQVTAHMLGMAALGNPTPANLAALDEHAQSKRAPQVQREKTEALQLGSALLDRWYLPGITCHRPEMGDAVEGLERRMVGGGTGFPDYTLHIPPSDYLLPEPGPCGPYWQRPPVLAALELKSLDVWPLTARGGPSQLGGLSHAQARWLGVLHDCGYQTCVAYGAEMALAWFGRVAGPRPDVLPEGW